MEAITGKAKMYRHIAISVLTDVTTMLPLNTRRLRPFLDEVGFINDPSRSWQKAFAAYVVRRPR